MDLMEVQRSVSRDDGDVVFNVLGIILWLGKWTLGVCTGFCLCVHTLCTSVCLSVPDLINFLGVYYILGSISTPWYDLLSVCVCGLMAA